MAHSDKVLALANLVCFDNHKILSRKILLRKIQSKCLCHSQFCCCRNKDSAAVAVVEVSHNSEVMLMLTDEGGLKTVLCTKRWLSQRQHDQMEHCQRWLTPYKVVQWKLCWHQEKCLWLSNMTACLNHFCQSWHVLLTLTWLHHEQQ